MTIQDIINQFDSNAEIIVTYFVALLIISLLGLLFVNKTNYKSPINYIYTLLTYAVSIPGLLSIILVLYSFFFLHKNLMEVNVLAYYVPIIAMGLILFIIKKTVPLRLIPGFNRLSGLFMLIFVAFILTYILQRMFFGVFFIGSFLHLIAIFVVLLIILKIGWSKITR